MAKKPETVLPDEQLPTEGGSYIRQPDGVLELQERTQETHRLNKIPMTIKSTLTPRS